MPESMLEPIIEIHVANFLFSTRIDTNIICIVDCSCEYALEFFLMILVKAARLEGLCMYYFIKSGIQDRYYYPYNDHYYSPEYQYDSLLWKSSICLYPYETNYLYTPSSIGVNVK